MKPGHAQRGDCMHIFYLYVVNLKNITLEIYIQNKRDNCANSTRLSKIPEIITKSSICIFYNDQTI